jgi:hypothetical protein
MSKFVSARLGMLALGAAAVASPVAMGGDLFGICGGIMPRPAADITSWPEFVGMSDDGKTVVGNFNVEWETHRPWRWTPGGEPVVLPLPEGFTFYARALSGDGKRVILNSSSSYFAWSEEEGLVFLGERPAEWGPLMPTHTDFTGSTFVGYTTLNGANRAIRWTQENGFEDLGAPAVGSFHSHVARAVSADGQVIAGFSRFLETLESVSWVWTAETGMQLLEGAPGYRGFRPQSISADGSRVAGFGIAGDLARTWIWTEESGMTMLPAPEEGVKTLIPVLGRLGESLIVGGATFQGFLEARSWVWDGKTASWLTDYVESRGLSLAGWELLAGAYAVSPDGRYFIGERRPMEDPTWPHLYWMQFPQGGCPLCPGDLNGDGNVEFADLLMLLSGWGSCPEVGACPGDVTGEPGTPDGVVDFMDLLYILSHWGPCSPA